MKRSIASILAAIVGLAGFPVSGQTPDPLRQPASVRNVTVALEDAYYQQEEPSPSDVPVAAKESKGTKGRYGKGCDPCEPWRLLPELPMGFTLTGWLNGGATVNAQPTVSRFNGPLTFNDRREVQFNQTYAVLERLADPDYGWDWGLRVDLLFGSDFFFTQSVGLETRDDGTPKWNSRPRQLYGLAMPQAYGEIVYNDLSLKLGHFYTIMGYEVVPAPGNFFYSHAYVHTYGEPFTHTGGLLTWNYNDRWTLYGGLVNGWDRFDGPSDRLAVLSGATYTPDHGRYEITFTSIAGQEPNDSGTMTDRFLYSLIFTWHVTDRLDYVIQHDNGWQEDFFGNAPGVDVEWYGLNHYLFYKINDCWQAGARFEVFRDDDGVRVTGLRPGNPNAGPFVGNFYNITLGLNWRPRANLTLRSEVRWDWFDGTGLPFDDGTQDDQFTAAFDAIFVW